MKRDLAALLLAIAIMPKGCDAAPDPLVRLVPDGLLNSTTLVRDQQVLDAWLRQDVGRHWTLPNGTLVVHVGPLPVPPCNGADACHTFEAGRPVGYVGLGPFDGEAKLLQAASHELVEMVSDPTLDQAVDGPDGRYLREAADPVSAVTVPFSYHKTTYWMSDYVFPEYFGGDTWPYDRAGVVPCDLCPVTGGAQTVLKGGAWDEMPGTYQPSV